MKINPKKVMKQSPRKAMIFNIRTDILKKKKPNERQEWISGIWSWNFIKEIDETEPWKGIFNIINAMFTSHGKQQNGALERPWNETLWRGVSSCTVPISWHGPASEMVYTTELSPINGLLNQLYYGGLTTTGQTPPKHCFPQNCGNMQACKILNQARGFRLFQRGPGLGRFLTSKASKRTPKVKVGITKSNSGGSQMLEILTEGPDSLRSKLVPLIRLKGVPEAPWIFAGGSVGIVEKAQPSRGPIAAKEVIIKSS